MDIYTADQIKTARQADLPAWLQAHGYNLQWEGRNWRVPGHAGLLIQGNHYKHFSSGAGGNSLDFLVDFLGYKFLDAVHELTRTAPSPDHQQPVQVPEPPAPKEFMPPAPERGPYRRVIAYLTQTRGLPVSLVTRLIHDKLLYQDQYGNCVFPCRDRDGATRGAIIRGTYSDIRYVARAPGSDASYGWRWSPAQSSGQMVIAESPIDAMSLAVLWPEVRLHHILALGGLILAGVQRFLDEYSSDVKVVIMALDSDQAGWEATNAWADNLQQRGYDVQVYSPMAGKDWNEMLNYNSFPASPDRVSAAAEWGDER